MSEVTFELSIPLDNDGFIELECDYCKNRFMISGEEFKNGDFVHMFCPICGLPNQLNTFYTSEVINKSMELAKQWVISSLQKSLGKSMKAINRSGVVNMSMQIPKTNPEFELFEPSNSYVIASLKCCGFKVKVREIDHQIGVYCPKCGGCHI